MRRNYCLLILVTIFIGNLLGVGGDDFTSAALIQYLPYTDSGDTSLLTNTTGNATPDAIYVLNSLVPLTNVDISLMNSSYDTYLRLYDSDAITMLLSNDDYGGSFCSALMDLTLDANHIYYIVVEGCGGSGEYVIDITSDYSGSIVDLDAPMPVYNAYPAIGSYNIPTDFTLSWDFGENTETYDLYFDIVNPPTTQVVDGAIAGDSAAINLTNLISGTYYYWKVVSHNTITTNTSVSEFNFQTAFESNIITIGDGDLEDCRLPIEPYRDYSYTQTIYHQNEINLSHNYITNIAYHFNQGGDLEMSREWVILLGQTTNSEFQDTDSWIPYSELTEVYRGGVPPIHADGWIEFPLSTPFFIDNTENLVVAVAENQPDYDSSYQDFFCTATSEARSLCYYDWDETNLQNPPVATELSNNIPNIRMITEVVSTTPLVYQSHSLVDFHDTYIQTATEPVLAGVYNVSSSDITIESVTLDDTVNFALDDNNTYPMVLQSFDGAEFNITFHPPLVGQISANIVVTDNLNQTYTIPLIGNAIDYAGGEYPYQEAFTYSQMPGGWTASPEVDGWCLHEAHSGWDPDSYGDPNDFISIHHDADDSPKHLYSPYFNLAGLTAPELSFAYWIDECDETSYITINVLQNGNIVNTLVNLEEDSQGWIYLQIPLSDFIGQTIAFDFEGVRADHYSAIVGLDHVAVYDADMPPIMTHVQDPWSGAINIHNPAELSWNYAPAATGYYLSVGTDNPPTDFHYMLDIGNVLNYDLYGLLTGTQHYWQIIPYNANGYADPCQIWRFHTYGNLPNPPILEYPLDNTIEANLTPTFYWDNDLDFQDGYKLYVGTDNPPTSVLNGFDVGHEREYQLQNNLAYDTLYYWKVVSYNAEGDAPNCQIRSFRTRDYGTVVIGDNQSYTSKNPIRPCADYSYTQNIYPASEFDYYGYIHDVSYHYNGTEGLVNSNNWSIYMGLTNRSEFYTSNTPVPLDSLTLVYDNQFDGPTEDCWLDFELDEPFYFDGSENLIIGVVEKSPGLSWTSEGFYSTSVYPEYRSLKAYRDNDPINPANPPYLSRNSFIANTRFSMSQSNSDSVYCVVDDDFEDYEDFVTDFGGWTVLSQSNSSVSNFLNGVSIPRDEDIYGYCIFNPDSTVPPLQDADPYSGEKYVACIGVEGYQNDDWLISPIIQLSNDQASLEFVSRSYSIDIAPEQFQVAISDGSLNPDDFSIISGYSPVFVPENWTLFQYSLNNNLSEDIRIAIHCTSNQTNGFLMIDDITIANTGATVENGDVSNNSIITTLCNNYPNPFNPETTIMFTVSDNAVRTKISIYNIRGEKTQTLVNEHLPVGKHSVVWNGRDHSNKQVASGVYFVRMKSGSYSSTKKMILMK